CRSVNAIIVGVLVFLSGSLGLCAQDLGFVEYEEHVLLTLGADLAPGGKYLAHELVEPLLEQVTLGAHEDQLTSERFAAPIGGFQRLLQGCNIFGGRRQTHCRIRLTLPSESSQKNRWKRHIFRLPVDTKRPCAHASQTGQFRRATSAVAAP